VRAASIFGTRPEAIKLMPVLREMQARPHEFESVAIVTSQHTDLLNPLLDLFAIRADHKLGVMRPGQSLDELLGRLMLALSSTLDATQPDLIIVQGDTTSALAGAMAAHHRRIPLVHVEAGLRSGERYNPFPEEMNRRLITQLATLHMAATQRNLDTLLAEGVARQSIVLTGNPVIDALQAVLRATRPGEATEQLIASLAGKKIIVATSHRRESFGDVMHANLATLSEFVVRRNDTALVMLVHPNPEVQRACARLAGASPRIHLLSPMLYPDFLHLLSASWLIVSDSGGIQEEAPTLGKPLLVMRKNTERPEVIDCGSARLVGGDPARLAELLHEAYDDGRWVESIRTIANPFGDGQAARRIADAMLAHFKSKISAPITPELIAS
jgi:UDP-N-acetylglucosamine 2-epimerase (non-hydrolysing)